MSNESNIQNSHYSLERTDQKDKKTTISFIVLGIIQVLYIIVSFVIGKSFGNFGGNDQLFYPYSRNAQRTGSICILGIGILNLFYIIFNQKITLHNKKLNLGMKAGIPVLSWGLSEFLYRTGYNSTSWNAISTLYGVYNSRKTD